MVAVVEISIKEQHIPDKVFRRLFLSGIYRMANTRKRRTSARKQHGGVNDNERHLKITLPLRISRNNLPHGNQNLSEDARQTRNEFEDVYPTDAHIKNYIRFTINNPSSMITPLLNTAINDNTGGYSFTLLSTVFNDDPDTFSIIMEVETYLSDDEITAFFTDYNYNNLIYEGQSVANGIVSEDNGWAVHIPGFNQYLYARTYYNGVDQIMIENVLENNQQPAGGARRLRKSKKRRVTRKKRRGGRR